MQLELSTAQGQPWVPTQQVMQNPIIVPPINLDIKRSGEQDTEAGHDIQHLDQED